MGELVSLFDLGILAKRYWKMIVVLVVAGGLLGAVYSTLNSGVEYQAEATLTPVDPTGAVAPITMMSAVSPIAERLATNAPDDVSLTTSQSEAPTTGSQVLTFVARGKSAEACVNAVNEVASASAVEAAALYAEISEEREEDSIVEKDEKIKIIELLEAQDGISRALDTGFRIDRSFAHVSFQVSEATSAKELAHAGLLEMLLTGALGGAVVAVIVVLGVRTKTWIKKGSERSPHVRQGHDRTRPPGAGGGHEPGGGRRARGRRPDHGGQLGAGPAAPRAQREARPSAHAASTASC